MLKLMGMDYTIQYKKGKEDLAADALSRVKFEEGSIKATMVVVPTWVNELTESYKRDEYVQPIIMELTVLPGSRPDYSYQQGVLKYKGRILVGKNGALR